MNGHTTDFRYKKRAITSSFDTITNVPATKKAQTDNRGALSGLFYATFYLTIVIENAKCYIKQNSQFHQNCEP